MFCKYCLLRFSACSLETWNAYCLAFYCQIHNKPEHYRVVADLDSDVFLMDHPRITRQDIYNSIKNRMRTPSPTFSVSSPLPFIEHKDSFFEYDSMEDSGIKMDFMELDDVMVPEFELSDDNDDGDAIY